MYKGEKRTRAIVAECVNIAKKINTGGLDTWEPLYGLAKEIERCGWGGQNLLMAIEAVEMGAVAAQLIDTAKDLKYAIKNKIY